MTTWTWDPFRAMEALRREVDRAFEGFTNGPRTVSRTSFLPGIAARRYPLLNLSEDADNFYVTALAPGISPESLEVSVVRDQLTLSGEKSATDDKVKPEAFHRVERAAGKFRRSISLPARVDEDKVEADYRDGVLTVTLPKSQEAKPKQIAVSVN